MTGIVGLGERIIAGLVMLAIVGCDDRPNGWTAFVYEDATNLYKAETLTGFKSFEACQQAAIATLRSYPNPDAGDYECGRKCRWDSDYQAHICKETRN